MSLRTHLDRYCQLRAMSHETISPTRRSRSPTRASSSAMGSSSLQHPPNRTPPTTPHRPVIFQLDLKPMQQLAVRNPYYNILTPKVAGNLPTATYDSLFQTFKVIYPDMLAVISFQTSKQWSPTRSYNDGRYTYQLQISTWWLTPIKELRCLMTSLILFWTFWTGFTRHGKLINISMPSRLVSVHLCCWHPIQMHKTQASLYMFKWFPVGIHSSRPPDTLKRLSD